MNFGPTSHFRSIAALFAALAVTAVASAQVTVVNQAVHDFDTLVRNYNLISLGNASFGSGYGDTEGPIAVQGNLSLNGGSIGNQPGKYGATSDPTLYVGGSLTMNGFTTINTGYASTPNVGGGFSWDGTQRRLTGGGGTLSMNDSSATTSPITNSGPANWNWSSISSSATSIQNTLANAAALGAGTGTISASGGNLNFNVTGNPSGVVVFNLDASLLSGNTYNGQSFSNISLNVPTGDLFVVNVTNVANGQTLFGTGSGINFNQGSGYDRLLWNILPSTGPSTSVSLGNGGQFFGSVLAPLIDLGNTASNSVPVNGQIIAGSYTHSGAELHYTGFDASSIPFSAVPEPGTYALGAVGLCIAGIIWQRRRKSA